MSPSEHAAEPFLMGGGEMGQRIRAFPWDRTALGPPAGWPRSLKTAIRIMLLSRQPIWIGWGPELLYFYNDPYKSIVGGKHPGALGTPTLDVWHELRPVIEPMLRQAMIGSEGTYVEKQLLIMERNGYPEETHYTYSYTPIPNDDGQPGGVICANTDDTLRVIGERQLSTLRELAAATTDLRDWRDVCVRASSALGTNNRDLPFALIYMLDARSGELTLEGASGLTRDHPAAPRTFRLDDRTMAWPLADAIRTHEPRDFLLDPGAGLPTGAWPKSPSRAIAIPIATSTPGGRTGVLVAAINPFRILDADYRAFLTMAVGQLSAAVAVADAYQAERARAESLAELDRAKTTFFSNVSHEFRTPLTLMLGPAEDALAVEADESQRTRLDTIHRNARRLQKLVNALLDFSRIEAGRIRVSFAPTDIAALTADLASVFRSAVERAGMKLTITRRPLSGEPVYIDRDMYEKIILNLVSNAFKYTMQGEIEVGLRDLPREVEVFVRDTGVGIAAAELPRLFDRFHRVEGVRARTHEGSGIGLALVQELVKLHQGRIRVESEVGRGTTFIVSLPKGRAHLPADRVTTAVEPTGGTLAEAFADEAMRWLPDDDNPVPTAHDTARAAGENAPRVILADDNADMRSYVRKLLSGQFAVEAVPDGRAALHAARRERPDLIVTDVMMPELDGFRLIRELRDDPTIRDVPVLMLSARAGEEARLEGLSAGADDYLVKPFSGRELVTRVQTQLQLSKMRREGEARERALRAEAERAGKMKDEFLATLSHELRTPLNAILGWAHLLRRKPPTPENIAQGLTVIERNARTQSQLIADLLDMSRIISGKMRLEVQRVELPVVIEAALESIRPAAEAKDVRIQSVLEPVFEPVHGDPARIQQVVWNLLSNAVKFTPKGGRVQVILARVNSHVEIVVSDTGQGIPPDFLPYVFERFRQGDGSASREHGGLGLGLAIVKQLVELHGGTVHASSSGEGRGATFRIHLPLAVVRHHEPDTVRIHPRAAPLSPPEVQTPALAGVDVLVVDDELDARDIVKRVLEDAGAAVWTAGSAREGHQLLAGRGFHVIISDVGMREEDGYAFIRNARKNGHRMPAAALTAFARTEDRTKAMLAGYQAHLSKPVDMYELLATVAALAERRGPAGA